MVGIFNVHLCMHCIAWMRAGEPPQGGAAIIYLFRFKDKLSCVGITCHPSRAAIESTSSPGERWRGGVYVVGEEDEGR